eukprot:11564399-Alexandrium_andersonii.AAC.1
MQVFRGKPDVLQSTVLDDLKSRVSKKLKPLTDAGRLSDLVKCARDGAAVGRSCQNPEEVERCGEFWQF